jgi:hypothetical protein
MGIPSAHCFQYFAVMKKLLPLIFGCLLAGLTLAQGLWLSPQRYYFTIRDIANIHFLMGEHFNAKDWMATTTGIEHLVLYTPAGITKELTPPATNGSGLQVSLSEEGTHMVVCNSVSTAAAWEADDFNSYLQQEGLDQISRYRHQHGEERSKGSAYIQYGAKTIFQVGSKITDDCQHPSLLALDIIPEENPYAVQEGTNSEKPVKKRFQLLFDGQPLYNVLVKIWYRGTANSIKLDSARSNRRGWISIDRHPGQNLVTATHMERNGPGSEVNSQAYHTSLSFEYSRFFPGKTGR